MITSLLGSARSAWKRGRVFAATHKVVATVIMFAVLYGGYYIYGKLTAPSSATRYVTATVATGTVVAVLTETGQVNASHQITLSPQASGQVVGIYVKPGDTVYAGQIIAELDATTAVQSLRSAELALKNAELSYQQATASTTLALNLVVAKNGSTNAQIALQKAHDDAYASIASIYSDLSSVVSGLDTVLHNSNVAGRTNQQNVAAFADLVSPYDASIGIYKNSAEISYTAAYAAYMAGLAAYKATNSGISSDELVALARSTYAAAQAVAEAVRNSHDFFDRVTTDYSLYNLGTSQTLAGLLSSTNAYTATVSGDLGSALSSQSAIVSAKQAVAQAENTLQTVASGSNALTVQQAALSLQQAKNSVTSAQIAVANYSVVAPFRGQIAAVGVQKYDQAGSGTAVATLVTAEKTASVSVNEIDASKIRVGQKATLTFDALPDVSIVGTVASVDSVGTVSQGVVSYSVIIGFDTPNGSVMPGMSVTADIVTGSASGLVVPQSAVKVAGGESYVQVFDPPLAGSETSTGAPSNVAPARVPVVTGLASDTSVIVTSGLSAGTQVVTQTIPGTAAVPAAKSPSLLGGSSGGASAGSVRALTR